MSTLGHGDGMLCRKALAFLLRDFRIEKSYKLEFVFEWASSIFPVLIFYYISTFMDQGGNANRAGIVSDEPGYFPFVLVGLAFSQYISLALQTFSGTIRRAQLAGCLESTLNSRTSPGTIIVLSSLYTFTTKTLHICIAFAVGIALQSAAFGNVNLPALLLTTAFTALGFSGVGILSAALLVLTKRGDPVQRIVVPLLALVSGTYFPVSILPHWLQYVAQISPLTWALRSARHAAIRGFTVYELRVELAVLAIMALVLLPISVWAFDKAVERGRRDGSLVGY